jgi:hypothetical protein
MTPAGSSRGGWRRTPISATIPRCGKTCCRDRPREIAATLTEDSPRGRLLRETRPVFGKGLTSREVAELIAHAVAPAF